MTDKNNYSFSNNGGDINMDRLIPLCEEKYSPEKVELIKRASDYARSVHEKQKRESGEPYYIHPESVAISLAKMGMDADTVAAGLLHDVVEDGDGITVEKISELFGDDIGKMVDGVTKLTKTATDGKVKDEVKSREERQAENLRKMYLAMANDVRVVIIKLADRLHNMRTLGNCSPAKRQRIAKETLDIYAPLAGRFGMGAIKIELEDLSFQYLYPDEYKHLCAEIEPKQEERMELLESAKKKIQEALANAGIKCEISGRRKHIYSIFRKLKKNNKSLSEIYDLVALRVIVGSVSDCYAALGIIHNLWRSVPGRFKDYISTPKTNMYRSLHTTLFSDMGMSFEVQIRTWEMHRTAEYGVAAHWLYKEGRAKPDELDSKLAWVRDLISYEGDADSTREFIDNIKNDFLSDYVYVLTPNGEAIDLPAGSTPIDFAYRIHTKVGNHIQLVKVNNTISRIDYKLKTYDVVEIITSPQATPGRDWLNYVKTSNAKAKIRQWFKKANRDENILRGREMLTEAAKRQGIRLADIVKPEYYNPILKRYTLNELDDIYANIGFGGMLTSKVLHRLMEEYRKEKKQAEIEERTQDIDAAHTVSDAQGREIIFMGEKDMVVHYAKCCTPLYGDDIFGYVTRGRGVSIHRRDCPNAEALLMDTERIREVSWGTNNSKPFSVTLHVLAYNKLGVMNDITTLLHTMKINTTFFNAKPPVDSDCFEITMTLDITNAEQLNELISNLHKLDSVVEVERSNKS